jgi:hypothetical protein
MENLLLHYLQILQLARTSQESKHVKLCAEFVEFYWKEQQFTVAVVISSIVFSKMPLNQLSRRDKSQQLPSRAMSSNI